jgi:hypothetical protein
LLFGIVNDVSIIYTYIKLPHILENLKVVEIIDFFFQDFFGKVKNGQKKCPFLKNGERLCQKYSFCCIMKN